MKSKKILTILLSFAIMFTFMPAMAFAYDANNTWDASNKYATVKDSSGTSFVAYREFSDGLVKATPVANTTVGGSVTPPSEHAFFYDLDGSTFAYKNDDKYTGLDGKTVEQDYFEDTLMATSNSTLAAKLVEQDYVKKYAVDGETYKASAADSEGFDVYSIRYDSVDNIYEGVGYIGSYAYTFATSEYVQDSTENQTVTINMKKLYWNGDDEVDYSSSLTPDIFGTVGSVTFTVKGVATTPKTATFYLDSTESTYKTTADTTTTSDSIYGLYDGTSHAIVCDEVPGYTVSYEQYNFETGKWADATSVSIKDAGEAGEVRYRATFTKTGTTTKITTKNIDVELFPAIAKDNRVSFWSVGFGVTDATGTAPVATYKVSGAEYNAADYIAIARTPVASTDDKEVKAGKAAAAAAITANESELMSFFNDFFEVKATTTKGAENKVSLEIVEKEFNTTSELKTKKELLAKYQTLMNNFGINPSHIAYVIAGNDDVINSATVLLNQETKDTEIEFTSAVSSKTYKGSKTTKKGKLKKNQSFTVKAVANNGATVSYKLVNANSPKISINKSTGKITVKKGITKGTYKFKVKAYVVGDKDAYEYQAITLKIKK